MKHNIIMLSFIVLLCSITLVSASLTDGLVAYWNFDANSTVLSDITNHGLDGVFINSSNLTTGLINNSYHFNAPNKRAVNLTNDTRLQPTMNISISLWFNTSSASTTEEYLIRKRLSGYAVYLIGGRINAFFVNSSATTTLNFSTLVNDSLWHQAVITKNTTTFSLYVDGTLKNTTATGGAIAYGSGTIMFGRDGDSNANYYSGKIDESGLWNRTITPGEVTSLYNGGAGLAYANFIQDPTLTTTLISPADSSILTNNNITFSSNVTVQNVNLTNVTYFVYYSNTTIFNRTTVTLTGNTTNSSNLTIFSLTTGIYSWNVLSCGVNNTGTTCSFATSNFSFDLRPFTVNSEEFAANVSETSYQRFAINITTSSDILSVSIRLLYNGTSYLAASTCSSGFCNATRSIDIPLVSPGVLSEIKNFSWNITVFPTSGSPTTFSTSATAKQQNVSGIFLQDCGGLVTTRIVNYTVYDEQNLTRINPFSFQSAWNYWLGTGTVNRTSNFSNMGIAEKGICVAPAYETFRVNAIISYDDNGTVTTYSQRDYYYQNSSFTNTTQQTSLYLLNQSSATSFIIKVRDSTQQPITNALVYSLRYYPGENLTRIVQVGKTDDSGGTGGFFETEIPLYSFIIAKNGLTLQATSLQKVIPESAPYTLTFTIGNPLTDPWQQFQGIEDLVSSLVYNSTSGLVVYTYVDTSTTFTLSRLIVQQGNGTGANLGICDTNSSQPSGIITCNVTGYTGTIIAKGYNIRDASVIDKVSTFIISSLQTLSGLLGLLLFWFMLVAAAFAGISNPTISIALINVVIILFSILGVINFGWIAVIAILALSIYIIVEMNT